MSTNKKIKPVKEYLHKNLGIYLKNKRQSAGYTQQEVADKLGYTTAQFISNFERGLCSPPLNNLKAIIQLYDISAEEIMTLILKEQEYILRRALKQPIRKKRRA